MLNVDNGLQRNVYSGTWRGVYAGPGRAPVGNVVPGGTQLLSPSHAQQQVPRVLEFPLCFWSKSYHVQCFHDNKTINNSSPKLPLALNLFYFRLPGHWAKEARAGAAQLFLWLRQLKPPPLLKRPLRSHPILRPHSPEHCPAPPSQHRRPVKAQPQPVHCAGRQAAARARGPLRTPSHPLRILRST